MRLCWTSLFVAFFAAFATNASHAIWAVTETPICTNPFDQVAPAIYGNNIVWVDYRDEDTTSSDIWRYDTSQLIESPLAQAAGEQEEPAIFGMNVVYQDSRANPGHLPFSIWRSIIGGSSAKLTTSNADEELPKIFGDRVVLQRINGFQGDIIGFDLAALTEVQIAITAASEEMPDTSGHYTVFSKSVGGQYDIYGFDHNTQQSFPICVAPDDQIYASTDGVTVVWEDWRNPATAPDIYAYNFATGITTPIATGVAESQSPNVNGPYIVWEDKRSGNWAVWLYDLNTGQEQAVSGVTSSARFPKVFENKVVWQDRRNGNIDIYAGQVGPDFTPWQTIGQLKMQPDGTGLNLVDKPVTRNLGNSFAIMETDLSAGILVQGSYSTDAGERVEVKGILSTDANGQRVILPTATKFLTTNAPSPIIMTCGALSGTAFGTYTPGATGAYGLNNVSLLVKITGDVVEVGAGWFKLSDGSPLWGGIGPAEPIKVECPGLQEPTLHSRVSVSGISGLSKPGSDYLKVLRVVSQSDIFEESAP